MIAIVNALLAMIRSLFKSRSALHVKILVLRHQLNVLGRGSCHRVHLRHRLPHTQMLRDELGPHEHVGLLAARGTWLLAVVLAAVRRMMTAH
jgi:hypothetical protein